MIKSKVVNKSSVPVVNLIDKYPCVGISDNGTVVLFTSPPSYGVVLHVDDNNPHNTIGEISASWALDVFTLLPKDKHVEISNA